MLRPKTHEEARPSRLDPLGLILYARDHGRAAAIELIRSDPNSYAEEWAREHPGTRPPLWLDATGITRKLLRVETTPVRGLCYVEESEAAALARCGLLFEHERALWDAGALPREHPEPDPDHGLEPGSEVIDGPTWERLTEAERAAVCRRVRGASRRMQ